MKLDGREESENVEDRRGMGRKAGFAIAGAGGGGMLIVIICLLLGVDPQKLVGGAGQPDQGGDGQPVQPTDPEEEKLAHEAKVVFGDTERIWTDLFDKKLHQKYEKPTLVLFSGQVESACGMADAAVGPFYCPGDSNVYIDLSFYRDMMERKLHAGGQFARAYVVAHEVGHHVQRLLGYSTKPDRRHPDDTENDRSVRLELQADYLAGVWAHYGDEKYHFLEPGDVESAINAAQQIGDDRLQKAATGRVMPEKFTHGTSKQRAKWLNEGLKTGDIDGASQLFDLPYNRL
jgi:predicted metalloprotease